MWRGCGGLAFAIAGCLAAPPRPAPPESWPAAPCDNAAWRDAANGVRRAWLVTESRVAPVTVLDEAGGDVRVATVSPGAVVARWEPRAALGAAVVTRVALSPAAGEPGDPAVEVLPGYPLASPPGAWVALDRDAGEGLALTGYVPAAAAGTIWNEPRAPTARYGNAQDAYLLAEPRHDADVRAHVTPDLELELAPAEPGWLAATIHLPHALVHGFLSVTPSKDDFADDAIESGSPDAGGGDSLSPETCLYDAPGGRAVGLVLAPLRVTPTSAAEPGWLEVRLPTAWGPTTYYTNQPVVDMPATVWKPAGIVD